DTKYCPPRLTPNSPSPASYLPDGGARVLQKSTLCSSSSSVVEVVLEFFISGGG
ncbi:hypothetical protein Dimus_005760, partial [Dionaea muscipula]